MTDEKQPIESPSGLELHPEPPPTARISKKVGVAVLGVVVVVGVVVVGVVVAAGRVHGPARSRTAAALVAAILFLAPLPASAQSCALCYTQAASSGARMIQALKSGIIVLIAPPTLMSVGVIFVCYRKRNQTMKDDLNESDRDWKTGDEPRTAAQESYLSTLAREAGEEVPGNLTKAQASELIDKLQGRSDRLADS